MKLKDMKNEIKVLDITALLNRAKALKLEINDLVLDKNLNTIKDLKSVSKKKKELARVLTVMNQKRMIEGLESRDKSLESSEEKKKEVQKEKKGVKS